MGFLIQLPFLFVTLLLIWFYKDRKKYSKYPPGPFRLPVIGNLLQLARQPPMLPPLMFKKLGNDYGDADEVVFLKLGQYEAIILNSLDSMHEILTHEKTSDRFQLEIVKDRHKNRNLGVVFSHGKTWQNLRRFTLSNLKSFGFGKSSAIEVVINEEVEKFLERFDKEIKSSAGNVIHIKDPFSTSVANVLWRFVSGKAFDHDDPKLQEMIRLNKKWLASTSVGPDLSDPFPILRDLFPNFTGRTVQKEAHEELYAFGKQLLDEQKQLSKFQSEPETFIDVFSMKIENSKGDNESDFNDEQLVMTILDLFLGGYESSSSTLNFSILYMLLNPEVQEKVQNELDKEIPDGSPVDSAIKPQLPYTCATILEIFRQSTVAPIPAPREATEDFNFRGYLITRGTALVSNIYGGHHCKKVWGDPENFRPERFLNADGTAVDQNLADKLKNFGAGKRICLGKSLAERTVFHYFVSLLRRYKFVKVPGTSPTSEPKPGLTFSPLPYDVCVIDRMRN